MEVYKIELLIVDTDGVGEHDIKTIIENQNYPNHCIAPQVMHVDKVEVEWSDDHPLNKPDTMEQAYEELFG